MPAQKVDTATLIRGEVVSVRLPRHLDKGKPEGGPSDPIRFEYGKPVPVKDKDVLKYLEDMTDEITDGEGEVYEKPRFRVDRNVSTPEPESTGPRRTRLEANRTVKRKPRKRA